MVVRHNAALAAALAVAGILSGCGTSGSPEDYNLKPSFIGAVTATAYDGVTDDLLTAGLGKTKMQGAAPTYADPLNPTAKELRRHTIYTNYRALIDFSTAGGYGVLYGPNIDINGNPTLGEGLIAGDEYIAYADDGSGNVNVTMMVQIPANFDKANPCIITGTSSGSRGVYGAIGSSGDWGLKHKCAVAYTDKGSGVGFHDLTAGTVNLQNGLRSTAVAAGKNSNYTANIPAAELSAFNAAFPNRFAIKQAHSQENSEKNWGKYTLQSVEFAYYILNEKFAPLAVDGVRHVRQFKPANTIVIASSVSNGAGAALLAAEQDTQGLISGVAVAEPVAHVAPNAALTIKRGNTTAVGVAKSLMDNVTIANLYQPCASLSASVAASPLLFVTINAARATNRCTALAAKGLLKGTTLAAQADESLAMLRSSGWEAESDLLHASHYFAASPALAHLYTNMYGKFKVTDNVCGQSLAGITALGAPGPLAAAALAPLFATANGTPTGGVNLINNNSVGGALLDGLSFSPSTGLQDYNIDSALCFRGLLTGTNPATGAALTGTALAQSAAVKAGVAEVLRTANLRGKPAIIVHGRSDALVPVNHNSRPYFGLNKIVEGAASKLSYIEITNAQHFDAFIPAFAGYDTRFLPAHVYFNQALDRMYAHLKNGAPLPPSQVVRTIPRGGVPGAAPAITAANVPAIQGVPVAANLITFSNNTVTIPE